jgi:K+-sensing histidine kinase KdpD
LANLLATDEGIDPVERTLTRIGTQHPFPMAFFDLDATLNHPPSPILLDELAS